MRKTSTHVPKDDITDAAGAGADGGDHSWGFGSFLYIEQEYEGVLPDGADPSDVRPPWLASVAS